MLLSIYLSAVSRLSSNVLPRTAKSCLVCSEAEEVGTATAEARRRAEYAATSLAEHVFRKPDTMCRTGGIRAAIDAISLYNNAYCFEKRQIPKRGKNISYR